MESDVAVIALVQNGDASQQLGRSYAACEAIARRAASSFYPMFRFLPAVQRRGMCAIYAFLRITDDIGDESAPLETKRRQLQHWREGLERATRGEFEHDIHPALADTIQRHAIPVPYLVAALDGVAMDLQPVCYGSFAELQNYCYHVASVVGLACIRIWGCADARADEYAINAGIAFQLTNILRDLREDATRGRVYLPSEDLLQFGYTAEDLQGGVQNGAFRKLMQFEVERARHFYRAAWPLAPLLLPPGRMVFLAMARSYQALLDVMEQRDYDVFSSRVQLSRWRKMKAVLGALPARWGYVPA